VEQLARANDDLSNLMSSNDIATLFLDRDLCIQRFTPALQRIFNVMPGDVGRRLSDITHRLELTSFQQDCEHVLSTLQPVEREAPARDGSTFLMRITPYRTLADHIEGVVATFTDISRVTQAQEELRESEERHRLLIEGVQEYAIFMMNAAGCITLWNTGAERIFGWTEAEVMGRPGSLIFTAGDRDAGAPEREMATAAAEGQAADERWHVRRSGQLFWASGTLTALRGGAGELRGYVKVLRDNTLRRTQEETLRSSEAELRALSETLEERVAERTGELAAANERARHLASEVVLAEQRVRLEIARRVHDDLQQHLYGIQLRIAALAGSGEDVDNTAKPLAEIGKWLDDAVLMARQLALDLSPPALAGDDFGEALDWLAAQMQQMHHLEVDVHGADEIQLGSEDIRVLMFQSLREVLFNVVKHASKREALVEVELVDGMVAVHVTDEGPGFDPGSAIAASSGGFGLANVGERLRLLGGDMRIDSAPGRRTRITLVAPHTA
jgi:two-component system, chemotaxis family, CheB/CheR fusion protein